MTLDETLKDIEKISGKGSVMRGVIVKDVERIAFPAIAVTRMLHGGFPKGRMIEFAGPESSGKTTTSLLLAASYQKQDSRPVFFIDAEGTYDPRWAAMLGLDNAPERFVKWAPENVTAEEVFESILKIADTNEVGLIILDSIPTLVPQQEDAKTMSEYQMGGISKPLTVFSRKLQKILLKNDTVTFVGLNQVRDNMSQYGPTTSTVGGHAWKHICSIRLEFRSENVDSGGHYISDSVENPAGVRINVALKKNKSAIRDRKLSYYIIDFDKGFDWKQDVFQTALNLDLIKQSGASFSYLDCNTGEVLFKAMGRLNFVGGLSTDLWEKLKLEVLSYDSEYGEEQGTV